MNETNFFFFKTRTTGVDHKRTTEQKCIKKLRKTRKCASIRSYLLRVIDNVPYGNWQLSRLKKTLPPGVYIVVPLLVFR